MKYQALLLSLTLFYFSSCCLKTLEIEGITVNKRAYEEVKHLSTTSNSYYTIQGLKRNSLEQIQNPSPSILEQIKSLPDFTKICIINPGCDDPLCPDMSDCPTQSPLLITTLTNEKLLKFELLDNKDKVLLEAKVTKLPKFDTVKEVSFDHELNYDKIKVTTNQGSFIIINGHE